MSRLLGSLASHVAVALECALAKDNAELYQRQVVKERDRLRLLLEINNLSFPSWTLTNCSGRHRHRFGLIFVTTSRDFG